VSSRRTRSVTPRTELVAALSRAGRIQSDATVMFHSAVAERMGLSVTEQKTIGILDRLGPLSAGEIAAHTGLATASVTSLIDRLEAKGFAQRVRDQKDRRRVIVAVRAERLAAIGPLFDSLARAFLDLVATYEDEDLAVILDFMDQATDLLRRETAKLSHGAATSTETGSRASKTRGGDPRLQQG
jgi:DNA-binding MarR family transcriptional regulator